MTEDAPLEPIPATAEAFEMLGGEDVERDVRDLAALVQGQVPEVVGVSLTFREPAYTFTLAISDRSLLPLDAVQYLDDGPCVAAVFRDETVLVDDVLDEDRWSSYARTGAHLGILSSLSVPVHLHGDVVGGLNVYASTKDAFNGHETEIADLVQAPASAAIRDADLAFATRFAAEDTKRAVAHHRVVDLAAGILAAREGIPVDDAAVRLQVAADRAGVPVLELARLVVELRLG